MGQYYIETSGYLKYLRRVANEIREKNGCTRDYKTVKYINPEVVGWTMDVLADVIEHKIRQKQEAKQ